MHMPCVSPKPCMQVHYDSLSKQSEQTAEERQQLYACNNEIQEKIQEFHQASQAVQVSACINRSCPVHTVVVHFATCPTGETT